MKKTIFFRSTLRQPLRSLFLLLLVGVISFAFVARAGEYLLISQEQEQLTSYYRSVGTPVTLPSSSKRPSRDELMDYLEQSPYVAYTDRRVYTSGVIQDGYQNANFSPSGSLWIPSDPANFDRILPWDVYFYGTYTGNEFDAPLGKGLSSFPFTVDEVLAGYPEIITPGMSVSLWVDWGTFTGDPTKLQKGGRYLLCASRRYTISFDFGGPYYGRLTNPFDFAWLALDAKEGWYLPAEDLDLAQPEYADLANKIQQCHDNTCALHITATSDMSIMPAVLSSDDTGNRYLLANGRWLNHEDDLAGNRVMVIHQGLANARGLSVGDTITLTLRNIRYLDTDVNKYYAPPNGYLYDLPSAGPTIRTQTETFTIVGIYIHLPLPSGYDYGSSTYQLTFIPRSVFPESFTPLNTQVYTPSYSLVLDSPAHEEAFLDATREDLTAMGYTITFQENGYQNFKEATDGIGTAARSNVAIFAVILAVCFCLAVFVYFRFRRKDMAISRALGVPAGKCIVSSTLPLVLVGGVGIVAGSVLAWRYTQGNAETLLSALVEAAGAEGATATLPMNTLAVLDGTLIAALLALALIFATATVRKPVLSQLQGGRNKR